MRCSVVLMRHNGRRLTASSICAEPGIKGELLISDWIEGSSFGRAVRMTRLCSIESGTKADPLQPLFDPVLVRITADALILVGMEICADESGNPVDYAQSLLIKPLCRGDSILSPCSSLTIAERRLSTTMTAFTRPIGSARFWMREVRQMDVRQTMCRVHSAAVHGHLLTFTSRDRRAGTDWAQSLAVGGLNGDCRDHPSFKDRSLDRPLHLRYRPFDLGRPRSVRD